MEIRGFEARITLTAGASAALILGAAFCFVWPLRHAGSAAGVPGFRESQAAKEMRSHLNAISLGMLGYLNDHDAQYLDSVKSDIEGINQSLRQYQQDLPSGSAKDADRLETSYENLREASRELIQAEETKAQTLERLSHSRDDLTQLLAGKMEPGIHPNQLNATNRLRAVLEAEAEAKGLFVSRNGQMTADSGKFHDAIDAYQRYSRTRRTDAWGDEALALFDRSMAHVHEVADLETSKQSTLQKYFQAYQELSEELDEAAGDAPSWPTRIRGWWLPSGALMALWIVLTIGVARAFRRRMIRPLRDLTAATEAAATGDLTRMPDLWSHDEVGRLSQALNRLITVLARSENLVYHLATLVDSTGEAIISQTLDGTILSWNKGAQRLYGYSAEEVKGRSISLLTPQDGGHELMKLLDRVKNGERIQPFEMIHEGKNGRVAHVFLRAACILDSTKKVIGASLCAQDLTGANMLPPQWKQPSRRSKQQTEL